MYQTIILGSILLVSFYILKRFRKPKLNMPPLVRYKIPIIGHTYSYMFNSEEFIKQCKKEYGEIFSIYIWGEVRTIVGKEYSQEVLTRDDAFSFGKAFVETIPLDLLLKHAGVTNVPKLLKDYIFCKLNFYSERMQKCLHSAIQKYIDTNVNDGPKEESKHDEVITTFAGFISDLLTLQKIPPLLNFYYPGYLNQLYEEQLEVHKEADENGLLPFEALDNMKKLDSFIRESLRLTGHILALDHSVLKDYTFSNGLQLPKDHTVKIYVDDIYQDELLQGPNPKSFEPFRHVDTNVPASKIGKNFMLFGGGKHACPGRHFAINEIKFFLHNIILKYNICTKSGKIEGRRMYGPTAYPSSSGIIIEKRVK
ncbi:cytochrome P450 [Rhizophagus irregularis]|uniref:Cytochrome P450 n=1 Tax=Rhizophagus irregularis TaxID=588596 RepID=A0A2N1MDR9_9GLOM|nr:cytochrome P450 [Rhizophagus irregularis]